MLCTQIMHVQKEIFAIPRDHLMLNVFRLYHNGCSQKKFCSLWEQILSFKTSAHFGSNNKEIFTK